MGEVTISPELLAALAAVFTAIGAALPKILRAIGGGRLKLEARLEKLIDERTSDLRTMLREKEKREIELLAEVVTLRTRVAYLEAKLESSIAASACPLLRRPEPGTVTVT